MPDADERLDAARDRLRKVIIYTDIPTPMPVADALAIYLEALREAAERVNQECSEAEDRLAESELIMDVAPSRSTFDYFLRLDFGHGDREDDRKLYDAMETLRMVVR